MYKIVALAVLALGLGFTSLPMASAQDLELNIGPDGPKLRLRDDCDPRREDCRDDRDRGWARRECTPERALDKAERMGLHRTRIDRLGRRTLSVRGRNDDGDRVRIVFDRWDRRCPVIDRDMDY